MNTDRRRGTSYTGYLATEVWHDAKELLLFALCLACLAVIAYMVTDPRGFVEAVARVADGLWAVMQEAGL